jgi:hypothetical protein
MRSHDGYLAPGGGLETNLWEKRLSRVRETMNAPIGKQRQEQKLGIGE